MAGYRVTFASSYSSIESKYTTKYLKLPEEPRKQIQTLRSYIETLPNKPALFAVDDSANLMLDDNLPEFRDIACCPNANGELRRISDKTVMAELAMKAGLDVAPFRKISVNDCDENHSPIDLPVILKPYAGYAGGKGDIRICKTADEFKAAIQMLKKKQYSWIMIQRLIDSPEQYEIGLTGFSLPDGQVVIPCTIRKIRSYPAGRGSTSYAQVKNGLCGADEEKLKSFVRSTGYVGIFDIEMIAADGVPYFIEINYRNGQYGYAPTAAGYNIPANWFRGMLGEPIEKPGQVDEIYYINERDDFLHVKEGTVTFTQWMKEFRTAKAYGVFCHGDQWPYIRQYVKIPDRVKIKIKKVLTKFKDFFVREEWTIAIRPIGDKLLFEEGGTEQTFRIIPNSFRGWCADPYIISVENKDYLFFEMFDRFKGRGIIGCREIDEYGNIGRMRPAYETQKHLSFPFVFEKDSNIYMMPEGSYDRNLTLLKAEHFPDKWQAVKIWFKGEQTCDSVLFEDDGNTYLLTQPVDKPYTNAKLNLYILENDNWKPCSSNPVLNDASTARMAGAVINRNGKKIRPSQTCTADAYGTAVNFSEIVLVGNTGYEEKLICRISPEQLYVDSKDKYYGIHTYNRSRRYEVVDLKLKEKVQLGYFIGALRRKNQ